VIIAGSAEAIAVCSDCGKVLAALVRTENAQRYLTRKRPTLAQPGVEAVEVGTLRVRCPCRDSEYPYRGSRRHVVTRAALVDAADQRRGTRYAVLRLDPQPMVLAGMAHKRRHSTNTGSTA
jgi:hypothetical protein